MWLLTTLPLAALAQGSVTLSVSPTLFDMTASPTQVWSSSVRVINTNDFPLQVYTTVVNFAPSGESGQGTMIPVFESETEGTSLAEWITLDQEEVLIPAEQTVSIPFTISVPDDAAPGGHFAAILVGTRSFGDSNGAAQVETSQVVTSLLFLRVAGDIVESGQIRDFVTDRLIAESPEMSFSLRFENTGNVHIQPQGEITITNMWGKERGVVPINKASQFGNVLPESVRKYNFSWTGDWSFADIGRYKAVVTLGYGEQNRKFVDSTTTFWVIPWRALLLVLVIVGGLVWFIVWGIKLYIRRMLQLAGVTPGLQREYKHARQRRNVSIAAPIEEGILDLRAGLRAGEGSLLQRILTVAKAYKVFLVIFGALLVFISLFIWYLVLALTGDRGYEVSYEQNGQMVPLTVTEESAQDVAPQPIVVHTLPAVAVINRSGVPGVDTTVAERLRTLGYDVEIDSTQQPVVEDRTVIVYDPAYTDQVVQLQTILEDALVSAFEVEDPNEPMITIYIGADQAQ